MAQGFEDTGAEALEVGDVFGWDGVVDVVAIGCR